MCGWGGVRDGQAGNFVDLNATRARMRAFAAEGGTISCDSGAYTAAGVLDQRTHCAQL